MNRFEIRDILQAHKEHFRVLPTGAMTALFGIILEINKEEEEKYKETVAALHAKDEAAKKKKESPAQSLTVGKVAKKKAKKKGK